ncbi:hypothetical protein [Streptomyces sp. NPDC044948]|uniref:hypothetical protein n=1 Tax=Streptomyces sp. NPDC044948 TaxID=3157092 RepID=UPI0033F7644B
MIEHGFAHLKNWQILIRLRTSPARAPGSCGLCSSLRISIRQNGSPVIAEYSRGTDDGVFSELGPSLRLRWGRVLGFSSEGLLTEPGIGGVVVISAEPCQ